jgi:2,4-diketo-3-deoxy-L-fuconate hydrolase
MRIGNVAGIPVLLEDDRHCSIPAASQGRFPTMRAVLDAWDEFRAWHRDAAPLPWTAGRPDHLGAPVPDPGQILGVGLNYGDHKQESSSLLTHGDSGLPMVFSKFPTSVCGPHDEVWLSSDRVDFEVELVLVIGTTAEDVPAEEALSHVAGVMVGQDISDRGLQHASPPQLGLAKSFRTFAPTGPWLVTLDELPQLSDLAVRCTVNGEVQQSSTTSGMLVDPAHLVELFSRVGALRPGDLVFTGTPAGVGHRQDPPRFLRPGDVIGSVIDGVGSMSNRCISAPAPAFQPSPPPEQEGPS